MEEQVYHDMIEQQKKHWWFRARRTIIDKVLKKHIPEGDHKILEIGCGTGGNIPMLKKYGAVSAMEMDEFALKYSAETFEIDAREGSLPNKIPFEEKFDLICLFDVLEHVEEDKMALLKLSQMLNPGGKIFLTVPAHQWLYSSHDKTMHHFRRYSTTAFKTSISFSKMNISKISHFNFLLFPLLILTRLIDMISSSDESIGYKTPNAFLNGSLYTVFSLERFFINMISFPFGGSLFAVLEDSD